MSALSAIGPFLIAIALCLQAAAAEPEPLIKQVGENEYRYGLIEIDAKKKEVRFPVKINQTSENIEYALVNQNGKTHESLLSTEVTGKQLQIALLLCRFNAEPTAFDPEKPEKPTFLKIMLQGKEGPATPLQAWIYNGIAKKALTEPFWVFNGIPEPKSNEPPVDDTSLIAVYRDRFTAINFLDPDTANDDLWYPTPDKVPALGTEFILTISPVK